MLPAHALAMARKEKKKGRNKGLRKKEGKKINKGLGKEGKTRNKGLTKKSYGSIGFLPGLSGRKGRPQTRG
jgi:hypothetical protein